MTNHDIRVLVGFHKPKQTQKRKSGAIVGLRDFGRGLDFTMQGVQEEKQSQEVERRLPHDGPPIKHEVARL